MIVGIPKEIKNHEYRVAISPSGVLALKKHGHEVLIENNAGLGAGFSNEAYLQAGASIKESAKDIFEAASLIIKVKEPLPEEYTLIKAHHTVFTYFHFAASESLTKAMISTHATCIAYETVTNNDGSLPLLIPMSEIAGRMAVQAGAKYLERPMGGKGVLLGGVAGVNKGKVLILGGGVVGTEAAKMAAGLGAQVIVMDVNIQRLRYLEEILPKNVITLYSNELNIQNHITDSDLIIGAVLIAGAKAPTLITHSMLAKMQAGTVLVDVAVDQGGCIETCKPTTHENPIFTVNGIIHYCVANMPGAVPVTSTEALTNATIPYILQLANLGLEEAVVKNSALNKGLNIVNGTVIHEGIKKAF